MGEAVMAGAQSSFVWYELMSSDVAGAKAFYTKVAGWKTEDMPMPGMTYTLLRAGDTQIGGMWALPKDAAAQGMRPSWVSYISVDDVDGAASKVQSLGGKIYAAPADIPNVGRFAVVADPQGAMFNLFKPTQPGERVVSSEPGHIGWHELHTNDAPKAFDFYNAMFGWLKGDGMDMGPMGIYQLFTIGGTPVGAMFNSPAAQAAVLLQCRRYRRSGQTRQRWRRQDHARPAGSAGWRLDHPGRRPARRSIRAGGLEKVARRHAHIRDARAIIARAARRASPLSPIPGDKPVHNLRHVTQTSP
jgi:predicted enzyme related to lactoylglutathione lyase